MGIKPGPKKIAESTGKPDRRQRDNKEEKKRPYIKTTQTQKRRLKTAFFYAETLDHNPGELFCAPESIKSGRSVESVLNTIQRNLRYQREYLKHSNTKKAKPKYSAAANSSDRNLNP